MADRKIRILLADDQPMVRKGLAEIINSEHDMEIIAEASNGQDAVEQTRQCRPEVIIMDVSMPVMDGIQATRIICSDFPGVRIIGLSMCARAEEADAMRNAGAIDYLNKGEPTNTIIDAIRRAAASPQTRAFA
jgi:DNA-binding NarL/FixJ family response regulator